LVERREFATLKIATAFGDRLVIANLGLFLQFVGESMRWRIIRTV
jgi:hypothetical protein